MVVPKVIVLNRTFFVLETLDASVFSPTTALEEANLALQLKDRVGLDEIGYMIITD